MKVERVGKFNPNTGASCCECEAEMMTQGATEILRADVGHGSLTICARHLQQLAKAAIERLQPNIYPCGCSKHKVNLGRCDQYTPGELP